MSGTDIKTPISAILAALKEKMAQHRLDAYLVPSVDEHINEYLPENRKRREWASGFTGSAGDLLVGMDEAWVFVDSRYYEQADYEVDAKDIRVSKLGLSGHVNLTETILKLAGEAPTFRLGVDPFTLTVQQAKGFLKSFENTGIELVHLPENLVDQVRRDQEKDREGDREGVPPAALNEVYALPVHVTGQSLTDKLTAVRKKMNTLKVNLLPVTKLDQVAWLFNLRGSDIPYNPVFIAYAVVTGERALLFTEASRIRAKDAETLKTAGVEIFPYEAYPETLRALAGGQTSLVDPRHTTEGTLQLILSGEGRVREGDHPVEMLKAVKNETELQGMREANLKASRGKIRAWFWLEQQLAAGETVTEASFRDAIEAFYAEEEGFMGLSFNTIAGTGSNSSIVHYGTPDPHRELRLGELFLIDSGCQFMGGTTDDTRTVLVGDQATESQKFRFTAVLKAHINCAMQRFPAGTEGARLDGITRSALWQCGLDYGHGTGHGVGAFLNVHEGPNGIHRLATCAFEPGMITSIEPGFYEPGWGGIRLENLYCVQASSRPASLPHPNPPPQGGEGIRQNLAMQESGEGIHPTTSGQNGSSESGIHSGKRVPLPEKAAPEVSVAWLGFDSLTLIPFEPKLIDWDALYPGQLQWLRDYYEEILAKITPRLTEAEADWLRGICQTPFGA